MAGQGSYGLFDVVNLTNQATESSPRNRSVNTLQIHHTAYPSDSGSRALMDPGGRTVSANALLLMAAVLMEVVLAARRAYTSATAFDNQSFTVEVVNQSAGPEWRISEKQRLRLARLAVDLYRMGWLGSLTRAHIIGHWEVPGTYATACPGPDMDLDHIVWLANEIYAGRDPEPAPPTAPKGPPAMTLISLTQVHPSMMGLVTNNLTGLSKGVESQGEWDLLKRHLYGKLDGANGNTGNPVMPFQPSALLSSEIDLVMSKYIKPISRLTVQTDAQVTKDAVVSALQATGVTITDAQYDAIVGRGDLDEGQVALLVAQAISDQGVTLSPNQTASIAKAVNDLFAERVAA